MLFSKYVGSGNDFILIDNRELSFPSDDHTFISQICHRQYGIGADGVILLENSNNADFKMRIFNSDGFEAEMCGNGIRCLFKFLQECGEQRTSYLIKTKESKIRVTEDHGEIKAEMQEPFDMRWNLEIPIGPKKYQLHHLNTGVPHAVIFSDSISDSDINEVAPLLRFHETFHPKGTNVNFAIVKGNNTLNIRTYERGVEAETLACGTGATASALAAAYILGLELPIKVTTKSCWMGKPMIKFWMRF